MIRCKIAECENTGQSNWTANAIPIEINGDLSQCKRYNRINNYNGVQNCSAEMFNTSDIVECDEFVFNTEEVNILNEVCVLFV